MIIQVGFEICVQLPQVQMSCLLLSSSDAVLVVPLSLGFEFVGHTCYPSSLEKFERVLHYEDKGTCIEFRIIIECLFCFVLCLSFVS
jgi:hypothetical protein